MKCATEILAILLIVTIVFKNAFGQSRCRNPNRRNGYCISIYECPTLITLLQRTPISISDRSFLQNSQCTNGFGRAPHVCCGEDTGYDTTVAPVQVIPTSTASTTASTGDGKGSIIPTTPLCGPISRADKIYNGDNAAIDEFPWTVLLEYRSRNGQRLYECGGSLINQRYVITAAHCVTGAILTEVGSLVQVRLGEYDTTSPRDCVETDCADAIVEIGVEESIAHEGFDDKSSNRHNDIALIRLNRNVEYSDFIKPVCMPWVIGATQRSTAGSNLTVAGWGRTLLARKSNIKQKLVLPVNDQQSCAEKFAARQVNIVASQICAGGIYARDSCDGDSGGPLMKLVDKQRWVLEGVVSFGNKCGLSDWPGVYTRVSEFESWIKSNIRG